MGKSLKKIITTLHIIYANFMMFFVFYPWTGINTLIVLTGAILRIKFVVKFFLFLWANGMFWFVGRKINVEGRENIEKGKQYLLVMNHTSMFDFPAIMAVFPRVAWLGREVLLNIPVFGRMLEAIDYIAIYPGDAEKSKQSINTAIERSGRVNIAIFPEGTRTLDGEIKEFKKGFTYIVRGTDLDVLPVTLNGLFSWKQKFQWYLTPLEKVVLVVQPPVSNESLRKMSNEEMAIYMKKIIESGLLTNRSEK